MAQTMLLTSSSSTVSGLALDLKRQLPSSSSSSSSSSFHPTATIALFKSKAQAAPSRRLHPLSRRLKMVFLASLGGSVLQSKMSSLDWLRFLEAGRKFYCISNLNTAHPVPVHVEEVKVFQRLANDQFCNRNRCIIIIVAQERGKKE